MRNYGKKILGIVAAATMLCSVAVAAGCGTPDFKMEKPNATDYAGEVASNGGFAVEKGNYVYFINGVESNTADNTYGAVEKGALMRITKAQLAAGEYDKAVTVVPSLFVAKNYEAGIFIYGDYVYYATPTTEKNLEGKVENSYIDFKRAKLDGTEKAMSGKFFHLASNSAFYRYVEIDGVVYCMYEEDGALKSYNTKTGKTTVLVEGAGSYFYDKKDLENGNVYYTMSVKYNIDTENALDASYNQLYCVNAAATATEVGKKENGEISYTAVCNGASKKYTFDASYLENDYADFEAKDYTTYPYVNLGQLVLDGVGTTSQDAGWFNQDDKADSLELSGYTYTIKRYENGGVYFTRSTDSKLYYLADEKGENWNTVKGNDVAVAALDVVANDETKASTSALFEVTENAGVRTHSYLYVTGDALRKATALANGEAEEIVMARSIASVTLWKTEGDYLYYYGAEGNGNNLSRINYKGEANDYNVLLEKADYQPTKLALVEWNSSWYKPEMFTVGTDKAVVLYSNSQSYGNSSTAFNYVYATQIGTTAEIQANIDKYEAYNDYLDEYSSSADSQNLIKYFFALGPNAQPDQEIIDLYKDESKAETEQDAFYKEVLGKFSVAEGAEKAELATANEIIGLVGKMTEDDEEAIATAWADSLLKPEVEEDEDNSLPGWAIALIVVGSVLVVAAGAGVPFLVIYSKKKAEAKREAEATVNAYRRKKIDTTDDKTIDVYADEKAEETEATEATEEVVEEAVEEAVETTEESAE